ncbi:MAG: CpsD/CapB family tyrosine-protein kinase [Labrys sp. (in: a-proteobacteria)]
MERIKEAIERAKAQRDGLHQAAAPVRRSAPAAALQSVAATVVAAAPEPRETPVPPREAELLSPRHLEAKRVVAHQPNNPFAAPFDVLRTKILQEMDSKGWQVLVVTSPTANCGKTVTAVNLAFSIARHEERSVVLVDLDLRKPQVAETLGLKGAAKIEGLMAGRLTVSDAMATVDAEGQRIDVLASRGPVQGASDVIASRQIKDLVLELRRLPGRPVIVVDMPPLFVSDDVLAFLPLADCAVLAAAERRSTVSDVETSEQLLAEANLIGIVLTKSFDRSEAYNYSSYY